MSGNVRWGVTPNGFVWGMSGNVRWSVTPNGLVCISAPWAEIKVATSVCTGGSNMPPAYCDLDGSSPSAYTYKKQTIERWSVFYGDPERTRTVDLQRDRLAC